MNLPYTPRERRVIPNWRYYEATLAAGELDNWRIKRVGADSYAIDDYVDLWKEHRSVYRAGDLLSAAITNGKEDMAEVKDAASYILEREDTSTNSLVSSAKKVLGIEMGKTSSEIEIERLKECTATKDIRLFIHNIRQRLQLMPYNPFLYVDLSRAYLLMGQIKKAQEAIEMALHFGASDRFVARSAARFYLHLDDRERAYDIIRAKGAVAGDPWLMAAEISINMLRDKTSNYIKKGKDIIESGNCSPFGYTELASSIGTLEFSAGANRKSNKLFRKALIAPNDNSLAQVQWVNSFESLPFKIDKTVQNDYEVRTLEALEKFDFQQAMHEAVSWICDMPFAHKPINVGFDISTIVLGEFALASAIVDVGLRSDESNPSLLNNKAYCAGRAGQLEEAKDAIDKLNNSARKDEYPSLKVCIPATEGLFYYRSHQHEQGANKYKEAISIAKEVADNEGDKTLYKKALLNYCRERLLANDGDAEQIVNEAKAVDIENEKPELKLLLIEVVEEYNKNKHE